VKTLAAGYLAAAAAEAQSPVLLVAIAAWGGATVRYAASDAAVTFGGNAYGARPFRVGLPEASQEGGDPRVTLSLANHDLALSALCAAADPVGCAVTLTATFLDALTTSRTLLSGLVVDSYGLTEEACTLTLVPGATGLRARVPGRRAARTCPWTFKGTECGYAGADASCLHTDEDCAARTGGSNLANFGGFLFLITKEWSG
jgi:phage-related protein